LRKAFYAVLVGCLVVVAVVASSYILAPAPHLPDSLKKEFLSLGGSEDFLNYGNNWKFVSILGSEKALQVYHLWEKNLSAFKTMTQSILNDHNSYHNDFPIKESEYGDWIKENGKGYGPETTAGQRLAYESIYAACQILNQMRALALSNASLDVIKDATLYGNRTICSKRMFGKLDDLRDNATSNRFLRLVEKHPDFLNSLAENFIQETHGLQDSRYYDSRKITQLNRMVLWIYLTDSFDENVIDDYYLFLKASVNVYADFLANTNPNNPLANTCVPSLEIRAQRIAIDPEEATEFLRLVNLYIGWNEKKELYVDLKTLDPIVDFAIDENATYEYLLMLLEPASLISSYYYSVEELLSFYSEYGGDAYQIIDYPSQIPLNLFVYQLDFYCTGRVNNTEYTRFMFLKYWLEELAFRHDTMWGAMHDDKIRSESREHVYVVFFEGEYNLTRFDAELFTALCISYDIRPENGCVLKTEQQNKDLKALGFGSGVAEYDSFDIGHASPSPWVSKYFISSLDQFDGAIHYGNFIACDALNMHDIEVRGWIGITVYPYQWHHDAKYNIRW